MNIKRSNTFKLLLFLVLLFAGIASASTAALATKSSGAGSGVVGKLGQLSTSQVGHEAINLDGNAALDAFCAGNGTDGLSWATAYVIQNFVITDFNNTPCISISNTNRYLIIRGCNCSAPGVQFFGSAIALDSVQNVEVLNNDVHNVGGETQLGQMTNGISITSSSDVNVSGNDFTHCCYDSLWVTSSTNIAISGNYIAYSFGGIFSGALSCYLDANMIISDNTFVNITTWSTILCGGVNDSTISGNMLYGPSISGIFMGSSETGTGVVLGYNITAHIDYNDVVSSNYISSAAVAIEIGVAYNTVITQNIMIDCGIGFYPAPNLSVGSNSLSPPTPPFPIAAITSTVITTSNTINGKPVYYYANAVGLMPVDFTGAGEVILANCNGSTISDLTISSNADAAIQLIYSNGNTIDGNTIANQVIAGISLAGSNGNTIVNNTVKNSYNYGISTIFSNQNAITGNVISGCGSVGILIYEASNGSTVTKNTVENTAGYAMNVDGINNKICFNSFIDNNGGGIQATDDIGGNSWDDGAVQGNYWSDYTTRYPSATNNGIAWNIPYVLDGFGQDNYPVVSPTSKISHGPIYINGNAQLDAFCAGNGTDGLSWATAYVIDGFAINGNDASSCIKITDTTKYLIIRDCDLAGSAYSGTPFTLSDSAIGLFSVQHVRILNNNVHDNAGNGIFINASSDITVSGNNIMECHAQVLSAWYSENIEISNNYVANNPDFIFTPAVSGIYCTNVTIKGNTFLNNARFFTIGLTFATNDSTIEGNTLIGDGLGIALGAVQTINTGFGWGDHNIIVKDNYIDALLAIMIGLSYNVLITNNTMINGGIVFWPLPQLQGIGPAIPPIPLKSITSNTIDTSNTINGKPVYFYKNAVGLTSSNFAGAGEVILANCNASTISNLDFSFPNPIPIQLIYSNGNTVSGNTMTSQTGMGITLAASNGNTIINNTVKNALFYGISAIFSNQNTITGNIISSCNGVGILINQASNGSVVTGNMVENNSGYAIVLDGINNRIYYNTFINNNGGGVQAMDESGGNSWDDGSSQGNYWSDYTTRYPSATNNGVVWNIPYVLDGFGQDNYPLVISPFENPVLALISEIQVSLNHVRVLVGQLPCGCKKTLCLRLLLDAQWSLNNIAGKYNATGTVSLSSLHQLECTVNGIAEIARTKQISAACIITVGLIDQLENLTVTKAEFIVTSISTSISKLVNDINLNVAGKDKLKCVKLAAQLEWTLNDVERDLARHQCINTNDIHDLSTTVLNIKTIAHAPIISTDCTTIQALINQLACFV